MPIGSPALTPAIPLRGRKRRLSSLHWAVLLLLVSARLAALAAPGMPTAHGRPPAATAWTLPLLTTARAAHSITLREAARGYPVHLRAVVTYYDPYIDSRRPAFFVHDSTGGVFVALKTTPATGFKAGQIVEVSGVSGAGDYAPIVDRASARLVGESHLPAVAPRVSMNDMLGGGVDGQWVEIEGVVHAVRQTEKNAFLDLVLRDGVITALTVKVPGVFYDRLIDCKIILRGDAAPTFNHLGQMTGSHMVFPDLSTMKIEEQAVEDPWSLPVEPVADLLRYTPNTAFHHRSHIRGTMTLLWPGRMICLADGDRGLCASTEQTTPMDAGEMVDVVGFPVVGDFTPTLTHALYESATGRRPVPALAITAAEAMTGRHDAQLVKIAGQIIGRDESASDPTLVLSSGNFIFSAVLPRPDPLPALEDGSTVEIAGICVVESNGWTRSDGSGFPTPKLFRILMRSPADLVVVQRPSWWNAAHTLRVLALALALTLLALASTVVLWRRVRRQTEVIRAQLAETAALKDLAEAAQRAAEYQATHDGLTGVLNRSAIFTMLQREFELASRADTPTGLMMLDLDHFKRINDTYGHMAGDQVLKEAVRRIQHAVRSTDLVGRYGGEEFLVILPQCDAEQTQRCAERVRAAIAAEPVLAEGALLPVTTSVGSTVAIAPFHSQDESLSTVDAALYDAKHSGRNRAVHRDLPSLKAAKPRSRAARVSMRR